jgi:hypothetical protein
MTLSYKNKKTQTNIKLKCVKKNKHSIKSNTYRNKYKYKNKYKKMKGGDDFIMPEIIIPEPPIPAIFFGNEDYTTNLTLYKNIFKLEDNNKKIRETIGGIDVTHLYFNKSHPNYFISGLYYYDSTKNLDEDTITNMNRIKKHLIYQINIKLKTLSQVEDTELIFNLEKAKLDNELYGQGVYTYFANKGFAHLFVCLILNIFKLILSEKTIQKLKISLTAEYPEVNKIYEGFGFKINENRKQNNFNSRKIYSSDIPTLLSTCSTKSYNYTKYKIIIAIAPEFPEISRYSNKFDKFFNSINIV